MPSASRRIRILMVDDHVIFREGMRALLAKQPGFVVVSEAGTGVEAVAAVKETLPDVVLMDLVMPEQDGIEATRQIIALGLGVKVLVLTALAREEQLLDALEAGASGFVEKVSSVEDLVQAIRTVTRGERFLGADAAKIVVLQRYARDVQREQGGLAPRLLLREAVQRSQPPD